MSFFNRIKLLTPESVELDFILAGIGNRAYALLIDYIILVTIGVGYQVALVIVTTLLPELIGRLADNLENSRNWLLALLFLSYFFIYIGYFVLFEVFRQGQTPGKCWVKIRVISDDGRLVKLHQATLRALLRPIDDLLFLGVFFIILGKREKRIGDWIAGTLVIQEAEGNSSISISQEAHSLADRLPSEADLLRLETVYQVNLKTTARISNFGGLRRTKRSSLRFSRSTRLTYPTQGFNLCLINSL